MINQKAEKHTMTNDAQKNEDNKPAEKEANADDLSMQIAPDSIDLSALGENLDDGKEEGKAQQETQLEYLQKEVADWKDQAMRAMAEADNTRKRMLKEREDARKFAIAGFAKDVLDVADNMTRALEAVPEDLIETEPRINNLKEGIEATQRTLQKIFEQNKITPLDPAGEPFNPNFHEVMFEAPAPDKPPGTILQVIEVGYMLNDRLLRPARVGIAQDDGQGDNAGADDVNVSTEPGGNIDTEA